MTMHTRVRVLEHLLRTETGLKYRLQIGGHEFQAVAFRQPAGDWQLSLLPVEPDRSPVVRVRIGDVPGNDVHLNMDDVDALLLALASSQADRLQEAASNR